MKNIPPLALLTFSIWLACSMNLRAAAIAPDPASHWEGAIVISTTSPLDIEVDFVRNPPASPIE
jgi:hypothetical protein